MDALALAVRAILAVVFLAAAVGKLADLRGWRRGLEDLGVPRALAGPAAVLLPAAEAVIGVLLVADATAWWGALGALLLLLGFIGTITRSLARGQRPDCRCLGALGSGPAGRGLLARNAGLTLLAAWLVGGG